MRVVTTSSNAIFKNGRRLDGSYHTSDGVQALRFLEKFSTDSSKTPGIMRLQDVCKTGGIYIPSRFKRIYVENPDYGVPYITGGSILQLDPLQGSKILSKKYTNNLEALELHDGMILVTCSGTIGNTAFVNSTFEDAVGSPDILRVVADERKILPGYLYIFLNSPLGNALIQQKTYGGVIQHIEAHHVLDCKSSKQIGQERRKNKGDISNVFTLNRGWLANTVRDVVGMSVA